MSPTNSFDVVGCGYLRERHDETRHCELLGAHGNAAGGAVAWLTFYAIALMVVVLTNAPQASMIVVAATH